MAARPAVSETAFLRSPAKLNLFLELLARRDDGYHEIDTVMVAIDWWDQLQLTRREQPGVDLEVGWLPSAKTCSQRVGFSVTAFGVSGGQHNLVTRALTAFSERFEVSGGFRGRLLKSIPAGAGMGGASSNAAAALRCASALCGVPIDTPELWAIAAEIGSDVPFFLGAGARGYAARARGRGEKLESLELVRRLPVVVVFPSESLSTAKVYAASRVPEAPDSADRLVVAMQRGNLVQIRHAMGNRLSQPAQEIAPGIAEILESMWRAGLRTCQLTGSGSACFAIANTVRDAKRACARIRAQLQPGAIVAATWTVAVPSLVQIESNESCVNTFTG